MIAVATRRRAAATVALLLGFAAAPAPAQFRTLVPAGEPVVVSAGVARIGLGHVRQDPATRTGHVSVVFPPRPTQTAAPVNAQERVPATLQGWVARGRAAGNHGDLYDNRDRGHSRFESRLAPQVTATAYEPDAVAASLDYGLNRSLLFDAVTFGNSSTAITSGRYWRSLPRLALTDPGSTRHLARQHAANQLYVYPSHLDHRPETGDLFSANTPYVLISETSSRSDQPHVRAVALILAALRPDTKALARDQGLIAPTVQMLFRRAMPGVGSDADYLSGAAHPVVFDGRQIDFERLLYLANALSADALPPAVHLKVNVPPAPEPGIALFGDGLREALFDTPQAVARLFHGSARSRTYHADVCDTRDPNDRALRFHWRLLKGDPARVEIVTDGPGDCEASITVGWHDRVAASGPGSLPGSRLDIGVFADNGAALSAPGFLSVSFPPHEDRVYRPDGQIDAITYNDRARGKVYYNDLDRGKIYADPALFPTRDWRDSFAYDEAGRLLGWERERPGAQPRRFTRHGALVHETDALGRPLRAEIVQYPVERHSDTTLVVHERPTGRFLGYRYTGPDDRLGVAEPLD